MTQNAMACFQLIIGSAWTLLTGWKLPGLGFTPAQFLAFTIIFSLVCDFVMSLFQGRVSSINVSAPSAEAKQRFANEAYNRAEADWWSYYDSKYGD